MAELEGGITALTTEPEIVLREGLSFDFPQATKVIPDKLTKQLVGFVGARNIADRVPVHLRADRGDVPRRRHRRRAATRVTAPDGTTLDGPDQQLAA
jgi:hypothetical protein